MCGLGCDSRKASPQWFLGCGHAHVARGSGPGVRRDITLQVSRRRSSGLVGPAVDSPAIRPMGSGGRGGQLPNIDAGGRRSRLVRRASAGGERQSGSGVRWQRAHVASINGRVAADTTLLSKRSKVIVVPSCQRLRRMAQLAIALSSAMPLICSSSSSSTGVRRTALAPAVYTVVRPRRPASRVLRRSSWREPRYAPGCAWHIPVVANR